MTRGNVLIVDDNRLLSDSLIALLRTIGLDARAANSTQEAEEIIATRVQPDVIVLDLSMTGRPTPVSFLDKLRANAATANTAVILYTGAPHKVVGSLRTLSDAVVIKPGIDELCDQVEVLRQTGRPQAAAGSADVAHAPSTSHARPPDARALKLAGRRGGIRTRRSDC
jgi:CheY-like chemotaxis protein